MAKQIIKLSSLERHWRLLCRAVMSSCDVEQNSTGPWSNVWLLKAYRPQWVFNVQPTMQQGNGWILPAGGVHSCDARLGASSMEIMFAFNP